MDSSARESRSGESPGKDGIGAAGARWAGLLSLMVTAFGWGLNWPALRLLLREWPPLFSRGSAGVAASLLLAAVAWRHGERLSVPPAAMPRLLRSAFTNVFAWMGFSSLALKWLNVAEGALLVYTMPLWATLFAWPILGTRPTGRGFLALLLGLAGVGVLLGGAGLAPSAGKLAGAALALGAAVLFGLGTVLNREPLPMPPTAAVAWQVGLGCLPMALIGLLFERPDFAALSPAGGAVLLYMTIFPMGICYLSWFATLRHLPPATASTGMLMVPMIGVLSAAAALGEPFGWKEAMAMALTLGGVTLALRKGRSA